MFFNTNLPEPLPLEKIDLATCNIQTLERSIDSATDKRNFSGLKTVLDLIKEKHWNHIDVDCVLDWICRRAVSMKYTAKEFEDLKKYFPEIENTRLFEYTFSGLCRPPEKIKASFIHLALSNYNKELFDYFIDNGANIYQVNHQGRTPEQVIKKGIESYNAQIQICKKYEHAIPSYYTEPKIFYENCLKKLSILVDSGDANYQPSKLKI